ncbi:hypothetical protein B296_00001959 [Ensete ventricosum]|uniref:F-box domain-containing protein n=1 Tax=Ensete ventricosum TaxID=4639 RepID=A0A427B806_ENSVE|nr:hypothetical protein B296_00001959 [Ensete ventricosum]
MGAGASSITGPDGETGAHETGLGDLPESCVAAVLLHLDPLEICRAARLSRTFRGAASADFVWEAKLPENYVHLMELACGGKSPSSRKRRLCLKEIYARLCRPNPLDGGTKVLTACSSGSIWVESPSDLAVGFAASNMSMDGI